MAMWNNGTINFWYSGTGSFLLSSTALTIGNWSHICGVVTSQSDVKIYMNGRLDGSRVTATGAFTLTPVGGKFIIGNEGQLQAGRYFPGLIDDVRIFPTNLTASEVGKLYASEAPRFNVAVK